VNKYKILLTNGHWVFCHSEFDLQDFYNGIFGRTFLVCEIENTATRCDHVSYIEQIEDE
jgi:hypothetical protein